MIRSAVAADIDNILILTRACAAFMQQQGIFQWNAYYPSKEKFATDLERDELFVTETNGIIAGCIVISTLKDEEYRDIEWLTPDGKQFYIHRLAVHPEFQGRGIARSMMDFAEDLGRKQGITSVRLDTFSQNQRNQKFYKARGYHQLGDIYFPKQSEHPFHCYELVLNSPSQDE